MPALHHHLAHSTFSRYKEVFMGTTITSREFNRDVSAAKRAAEAGPVTITDHGRRSHVLMTVEEFDRLTAGKELLGDRLWR